MIKVHRGRTRNIEPQVVRWRRRRAAFKALLCKLKANVLAKGWTTEQTAAFLTTPQASLNNRSPREVLNARNVFQLALLCRIVLNCTNEVPSGAQYGSE